MRLSNIQLAKIASIGGLIVVSTGYLTRWKINDRLRQTDYYKESMSILRAHEGALHMLGEPIRDGSVDVTSKSNYTGPLSANVNVPVKGSKQKGVMHFWAIRDTDKSEWNVYRVELSLEKHQSRRLLIKNDENSLPTK